NEVGCRRCRHSQNLSRIMESIAPPGNHSTKADTLGFGTLCNGAGAGIWRRDQLVAYNSGIYLPDLSTRGDRAMLRRLWILFVLLSVVSGCGPSAKEKYDAAMRELDRTQERLDRLRPAYDAARLTAANALCREIAGTTPAESESAAIQGIGNALNQLATPPKDEAKQAEPAKKVPAGRKGDELDKIIENAAAAQKDLAEKQASVAALAAPAAKAKEVMNKINTRGTPEAKR